MKLTKSQLRQLIKEEIQNVNEKFNLNPLRGAFGKGEFEPLKEVYNALRILAEGLDEAHVRINELERKQP